MNIFELCSVSFDYLENFWELNDNLNNIKDVYIYIYIYLSLGIAYYYCHLLRNIKNINITSEATNR